MLYYHIWYKLNILDNVILSRFDILKRTTNYFLKLTLVKSTGGHDDRLSMVVEVTVEVVVILVTLTTIGGSRWW